jgi:hypothetical protein
MIKKQKEIELIKSDYENRLILAKHTSVENETKLIREKDSICFSLKQN